MLEGAARWWADVVSGRPLVLWRIALQNYRRSQLTRMAAALSFRTIFGLIPTLVVGLVVLHAFVSEEQVKGLVGEVLRFTGVDQIAVDEEKVRNVQQLRRVEAMTGINVFGFGFGDTAQSLRPDLAGGLAGGLSVGGQSAESVGGQGAMGGQASATSARVDEWITTLMQRIDGINFGAVGLVGALMLIYAALSMVVETEKCFNQICGATLGKSWLRRVKDYWALLTLGPLLLVASFGVRAGVERIAMRALGETPTTLVQGAASESVLMGSSSASGSLAKNLDARTREAGGEKGSPTAMQPGTTPQATREKTWLSRAAIGTTKFVLSVGISMGMLVVVFAAVPNMRVRVGPAVAGAVIAAVLWEVSKSLLGAYIANSMRSGYAALYGAVAIVPLFMLWVYVTWLIVLVGFQVTSTLQQYQTVSREGFRQGVLVALGLASDGAGQQASGLRLVDPAAAVLVLGCVSQRFTGGLATTATDVRGATGLEAPVASMLLDLLSRGGWVHRVLGAGEQASEAAHAAPDEERFALARAPDEILATDVLRFAEREGVEHRAHELGQSARAEQSLVRASPGGSTVMDVLSQAKHRALEGRTMADVREKH
jgi:membrane protein